MKRTFTIIILLTSYLFARAETQALYQKLDSVIAKREQYTQDKEQKIDMIKKSARVVTDKITLMKLYNEIYNEYNHFRFDSAMTYAKKGLELAIKEKNDYYYYLNTIHEAMLLATGGLYSEAKANLDQLTESKMDSTLLYEYNLAQYWLYTYWSDYSKDSEYRTVYWENKIKYLKRTVPLAKNIPTTTTISLGNISCILSATDISHCLIIIR